jgi:hypothetical protein
MRSTTEPWAQAVATVLLLFAVLTAGWLAAPAQAQGVVILKTAEECRSHPDMARRTDCTCYAQHMDQALARGRNPQLAMKEAYEACPDEANTRQWFTLKCTEQSALTVPKGIDTTAYCGCYGEQMGRRYKAHAPQPINSGDQNRIESLSTGTCRNSVTTPAAPVTLLGDDLSGGWVMTVHGLRFDLQTPPGKWEERKSPQGQRGKLFNGELVQSLYRGLVQPKPVRFYVDPDTGRFELGLHSGGSCQAASAQGGRIQGECSQFLMDGKAAFTLERAPAVSLAVPAITPVPQAIPLRPSAGPAAQPAANAAGPAEAAAANTAPSSAPPAAAASATAACPASGRRVCEMNCAANHMALSKQAVEKVRQCVRDCRASCPS